MRREIYRADERHTRALLERAPFVHLATTGEDGRPILRTVHAVVDEGALAFHGAPAGEKMEGLGRVAVASAEEVVASIPSWFLDAERACPATTYYEAVQAHGTLRIVSDPTRKARVLSLLMAKFQPEGGHVPIAADHPMYRKAVAGLLVAELAIDRIDGKSKLGQNRTVPERQQVLTHLWRRGAPGDVRAVALLVARFPELGEVEFLAAPEGLRSICHLEGEELDEAARLVDGAYWLTAYGHEDLRSAFARSSVRVGMRDEHGRLVAVARAMADDRVAWIYDVLVAPELRGRGVGRALMRLVLDHPDVRRARAVRLTTRDADPFYRTLGFGELSETPRHPWKSVEMIRFRGGHEGRSRRASA